jgi:ketosteroid isomerase-like protein
MSQRNVEVVQRFFEAVERHLQTWRPQGSLVEAVKTGDIPPGVKEALGYLSPGAEWNPVFSSETYRGGLEISKGWDELMEAAENYSLELLEATELDDDRVLAVFGPTLEGRSSGINVNAAVFAVVTLEGGLITRLHEYTDRRDALAAAGLSE